MAGTNSETNNYREYYKNNLEEAFRFQDFIMEKLHREGIVLQNIQSKKYQLKKENLLGMEIKYDMKYATTGNLYIEVSEKSDPKNEKYIPSGIFRNDDNWLFGIGDYEIFYLFSKKVLQRIFIGGSMKEIETPTSKGFLMPKSNAEKIAEKIFFFGGRND